MARLAETRPPAAPSSRLQWTKYERMLAAAAELGEAKDLDRVQMHEVAKKAGVSIATLYRYFPSKTHLFISVMIGELNKMSTAMGRREHEHAGRSAIDSTAEELRLALRSLMSRPMVASAMIRAVNSAQLARLPGIDRIDNSFQSALLTAARREHPSPRDVVVMRLLSQQWFAIVQSCLNGFITMDEAESDIQMACELLLTPPATPPRRHV